MSVVCDCDEEAVANLAETRDCDTALDWRAVVARKDLEIVVVSTNHRDLFEISREVLESGKHLLVEKPAARTLPEAEALFHLYQEICRKARLVAKVGFNHRFHPAILKAKQLLDSGELGPLLYLRGHYGHGGRPGYEQEWRANPELSGGGELLDQGIHLIDLSRWFLGEFERLSATLKNFYWKMPVEDNAFVLLETAEGKVAQLQASWTEWKNVFSLEIVAARGKIHVEGLGGSYGTETLSIHRRVSSLSTPFTHREEFPGRDLSWEKEWAHFREAIQSGTPWEGTLEDAYRAHALIARIYAEAAR